MRTTSYSRSFQCAGTMLSLCLVATGCTMLGTGPKLHKSARGTVQLQEVSDWSFEASHPAVIDQQTMLKIVKGVVTDEATSVSAKMPATGGKPMRVFSDEDAEFLAPLLAQGLSQAKPEQILGFTVSSSAGSGAEPTAGTLYVQGGSIYLTLAPSRSNRKVSGFTPSMAARIEKAQPFAGTNGAMAVVIDYQALAKSSMPAALPVAAQGKPMMAAASPGAKAAAKLEAAPSSTSSQTDAVTRSDSSPGELSNDEMLSRKIDELRQIRETNRMKDTEISVLKKEIAWMKQELRERTDEIKAMKASKVSVHPAQKKRPAEAFPTR